MRKTVQFGIVCVALIVHLLVGCAPTASGPRPIQEPVTLTFVMPSEYHNLYEPVLEQFKLKEPNITVEVRSQSFGGEPGDVTLIRWYQMNQFAALENNPALDLTPLIAQDVWFKPEDYFPGALDTFRREGKQLALPTGIDPNVIFFNQDLFDRMGVAYPLPGWTWEQFRQTAQQVTDVPAGIFGYRPSERYFDSLYFVYQNGGTLYDDQQNPRIDGAETIEAVEFYTSLFGPDGPAAALGQMRDTYGMGGGDVGIVTSKIGMWMDTVSSLSSYFGGMIRFKVGMAPLPRGEQGTALAQFEGLMIQASTANPQAAWRLVSFLAQQPNSWVYPARKSLADSPAFINAFGKDQAAGVRAAIENSTQLSGMNFGRFNTAMMAFSTAVNRSISEGIPAADALHSAQEDMQK